MQKVDLLVLHAKQLLTMENGLGLIEDGAVAVSDGKIIAVGATEELEALYEAEKFVDVTDKVVTPGLIDCHTHLLYAGSREKEHEMRRQGKSYLEILKAGGGILSTVKSVRDASEEELKNNGQKWLKKMLEYGVTTVEIKSGYGLNYETEKKMLKVIHALGADSDQEIIATFLGAHAYSKEARDNHQQYLDELKIMLEDFTDLADFCDIYVEDGAFSFEESKQILEVAKSLGYKIKLHANQVNRLNGAELAQRFKATSIDHLDNISDEELRLVKASGAVAVLLPGATEFLNSAHWPPARKIIDSGIPVAISTDFNPGSSPNPNIQDMMRLANYKLAMTSEEIFHAVTVNAAKAIDRSETSGSLVSGKRADLVFWDLSTLDAIFENSGQNPVTGVMIKGKRVF